MFLLSARKRGTIALNFCKRRPVVRSRFRSKRVTLLSSRKEMEDGIQQTPSMFKCQILALYKRRLLVLWAWARNGVYGVSFFFFFPLLLHGRSLHRYSNVWSLPSVCHIHVSRVEKWFFNFYSYIQCSTWERGRRRDQERGRYVYGMSCWRRLRPWTCPRKASRIWVWRWWRRRIGLHVRDDSLS